ncbi:MAG: hypothetical protein JW810_08050 [Sedimentisphaerales bacterium]|nr:hypothetical protein [Sedimentisphaerales bacterium]
MLQHDKNRLIRRPAAMVVWATWLALLFGSAVLEADILTQNSPNHASVDDYRAAWLADVGIAAEQVEFLVDFESGLSEGQNVSGVAGLFPGGLVIWDTSSSAAAVIRSSSTYFGGSVPEGIFAVAQNERPYLELDFSARPVDYISFQDIDHSGTQVIVDFVGGGSSSFQIETTATSGSSAEFVGIYRNDMPRIQRIRLDATGDNEWGIDNIRYGAFPVCLVNLEDFARLAAQWMAPGEQEADLDDSGLVDLVDLSILIHYWLAECPADWPL